MNFKKHAKKLELFLELEIDSIPAIAYLPSGSILFDKFKISSTKTGSWKLFRFGGSFLDEFNLKTVALLAAKMYSSDNIAGVIQLKILDNMYYKHVSEKDALDIRYNKSKTQEQADMYLARISVSESKIEYAKQQISSKFRRSF